MGCTRRDMPHLHSHQTRTGLAVFLVKKMGQEDCFFKTGGGWNGPPDDRETRRLWKSCDYTGGRIGDIPTQYVVVAKKSANLEEDAICFDEFGARSRNKLFYMKISRHKLFGQGLTSALCPF